MGSMVPQASGRMSMRMGSTGLGKNWFMSPFMPWQRQMGASLMMDLSPSQHSPGASAR